MNFDLINLLSKPTLNTIIVDLENSFKKSENRIDCLANYNSKTNKMSLIKRADIKLSIERDRDLLDEIAVQLNFVKSAWLQGRTEHE